MSRARFLARRALSRVTCAITRAIARRRRVGAWQDAQELLCALLTHHGRGEERVGVHDHGAAQQGLSLPLHGEEPGRARRLRGACSVRCVNDMQILGFVWGVGMVWECKPACV